MGRNNRLAVLMTCYNRKDKTIKCLEALSNAISKCRESIKVDVFLTDDGSTDGTAESICSNIYPFSLHLIKGNGNLYWNGGMVAAWEAALQQGKYDGYLWLNNDTYIYPNLFDELLEADDYSFKTYGVHGIYVGSTQDPITKKFTYGGFNFVSKWTLRDEFVHPDGKYHLCQCAHGNVTYISSDVFKKMGILYSGYLHGGGDHDYTYLAYKAGYPLIVLKSYVGVCENDHEKDGYDDFMNISLRKRIKYLYSPVGYNLHNTLLFQKRCFPYRYPFVWVMGYVKALFPNMYIRIYKYIRSNI